MVDIEEKIDFPLGILFSSTSSLSGALSMAVSSKYRSRFSTPTSIYPHLSCHQEDPNGVLLFRCCVIFG